MPCRENVGSLPVTIRVQDIVDTERVLPASSVGHGEETNCNQATTSSAVKVTLYFVLVQSGTTANNFSGAAPKYETSTTSAALLRPRG